MLLLVKPYKTVVPSGNFERVLQNYENLVASKPRLQKPFVYVKMIEQEKQQKMKQKLC